MARATKQLQRVLLVEDDRSVATVLGFVLQRGAGFDVMHATTCTSALEALERGVVDAVVLDLSLPDGGGEAVLAHLRELEADGDRPTPVWVLISALDRSEVMRRCGPLDNHFLAKPFDPWNLVRLIQRLLDERKNETTGPAPR